MKREIFVGWLTVGTIRTELYRITETGCKSFYLRAHVQHASPLGVALEEATAQPAAVIASGLAGNYMNDMNFCSARCSKLITIEQERIARLTNIAKPNESPADRPELVFDGRGINGPDEHRTRVATFNHPSNWPQDAKKYGPLFAASPILAVIVLMVENNAPQSPKIDPESHYIIGLKGSQIEQLRKAAKAVQS